MKQFTLRDLEDIINDLREKGATDTSLVLIKVINIDGYYPINTIKLDKDSDIIIHHER